MTSINTRIQAQQIRLGVKTAQILKQKESDENVSQKNVDHYQNTMLPVIRTIPLAYDAFGRTYHGSKEWVSDRYIPVPEKVAKLVEKAWLKAKSKR